MSPSGYLMAGLLIIIGLAAVAELVGPDDDGEKAALASAPVDTPELLKAYSAKAKQCNDVIKLAEDAKLIMERPAANRVNVEDVTWAQLPAGSKRGLAMAVRCSMLEGRDSADFNSFAVVYGYRSGKRLAQAHSAGSVSLD